jgi:DNA-directed RNA polymerase subunit RPC12/RpoP
LNDAKQNERKEEHPLPTESLKDIIAGVVESVMKEAKKPHITDEEKKRIDEAQQNRIESAASVREEIEQKKYFQEEQCGHKREDGTNVCVYVNGSNYILCQRCQFKIFPEENPKLFNQIFPLCFKRGR